jgi:hypothetical protein
MSRPSRYPLFALVLFLSSTFAASSQAFEVRELVASPSECPIADELRNDVIVKNLVDPALLNDPLERDSASTLAAWITQWSQSVMDLSDVPSQKSRVCVAIYRDPRGNARATSGMDIFFGISKYRELSASRFGGEGSWSAQALLAHEFGHLLQFAHGLSFDRQRSNELKELQADCVAGFVMEAMLRPYYPYEPDKYRGPLRREFDSMGDRAYLAFDHHGSPEDREGAFMKGSALAENALQAGLLPLASRKVIEACNEVYSADKPN